MLTQISTDLVCSNEFLIQVCRKLPMSSRLQLSSRAKRSLDLLFSFCFHYLPDHYTLHFHSVQSPHNCIYWLSHSPLALIHIVHTKSIISCQRLLKLTQQYMLYWMTHITYICTSSPTHAFFVYDTHTVQCLDCSDLN